MNILVVGSGGREHALAWKLKESRLTEKLFVLPGNPGMASFASCVEGISLTDNQGIIDFAKKNNIGLVVVGPEQPLANGLVDALTKAGIKAFGPTQQAAELEGSKAFAKEMMAKYHIPTAEYAVFTEAQAAKDYIRKKGAPIVVKADGLAAGKGVIVAMTMAEALQAVEDIMCDNAFGTAGARVVIEEFMQGEEVSLLAFTDGETVVPMVPSQDHKRIFDRDEGPNTGGMGTYAPAPVGTPEIVAQAMQEILCPMVQAMKKEGRVYKGCLYAGLMVTAEGPKVVEFNARFGDPETQVVLPLLKSDLAEIMLACVEGTLAEKEVLWKKEKAVCVIMASGGYPAAYEKGKVIRGLQDAVNAGCHIFHAGIAVKDGELVTNGGRVLGVTATAPDLKLAIRKAYQGVGRIHFDGEQHRHDIAYKAFKR